VQIWDTCINKAVVEVETEQWCAHAVLPGNSRSYCCLDGVQCIRAWLVVIEICCKLSWNQACGKEQVQDTASERFMASHFAQGFRTVSICADIYRQNVYTCWVSMLLYASGLNIYISLSLSLLH
jgi:hypothetical protein